MTAQPYNTTMSKQQLIKALQADIAALYSGVAGAGTVTSVGITPGSADITSTGGPIVGAGNITVDLSAAVKAGLPTSGTFTVTATGLTTAPTGTATWSRVGNLVLLNLPLVTGTSNSTGFSFTGLPAAIQPATLTQQIALPASTVENAGALLSASASILITAGSGTITFLNNGSATGFTNTATGKGLDASVTVGYLLN